MKRPGSSASSASPRTEPNPPESELGRNTAVRGLSLIRCARLFRCSRIQRRGSCWTFLAVLRNIDYGDVAGPDLRGLFQQWDTWGSLAQRMSPRPAATFFHNQWVRR